MKYVTLNNLTTNFKKFFYEVVVPHFSKKISESKNEIDAEIDNVQNKLNSVENDLHQTNANVAENTRERHSHSNKALLDTYTQSNNDLSSAVYYKHNHSNKALLDTYNQTNANLKDAVDKKHNHSNKTVIDNLAENNKGNLTFKGEEIKGGLSYPVGSIIELFDDVNPNGLFEGTWVEIE